MHNIKLIFLIIAFLCLLGIFFIQKIYFGISKEVKAIEIIQIFIFAVTVTSLLQALEMFSKKGHVELFVKRERVVLKEGDLFDFYSKNGFSIPKSLESLIYKRLYTAEDLSASVRTSTHKSLLDQLRMESEKRKSSYGEEHIPYLNKGIEDLEKMMSDLNSKVSYERADVTRDITINSSFMDNVKKQKSSLSLGDYYIFLRALIRNRIIEQDVTIINNGETEVTNVEAIIPAPYSDIEQNREGRIEKLNISGKSIPYSYEIEQERIIVKIQRLQVNEALNLRILSKENAIKKEECFCSKWSSERTIDRDKVRHIFFIIALFMYVVFFLLKIIPFF